MAPSAPLIYLQTLDFLTTILVIVVGGGEGNPLVRWLMHVHGVYGLILAKAAVAVLTLLAAYQHRARLLNRVTRVYAAVVLWNVAVAVLIASGDHSRG